MRRDDTFLKQLDNDGAAQRCLQQNRASRPSWVKLCAEGALLLPLQSGTRAILSRSLRAKWRRTLWDLEEEPCFGCSAFPCRSSFYSHFSGAEVEWLRCEALGQPGGFCQLCCRGRHALEDWMTPQERRDLPWITGAFAILGSSIFGAMIIAR
jgi:hypothetical protein